MKKIYEKPMAELVAFQTEEAITATTSVAAFAAFGLWRDSDTIDLDLE